MTPQEGGLRGTTYARETESIRIDRQIDEAGIAREPPGTRIAKSIELVLAEIPEGSVGR